MRTDAGTHEAEWVSCRRFPMRHKILLPRAAETNAKHAPRPRLGLGVRRQHKVGAGHV